MDHLGEVIEGTVSLYNLRVPFCTSLEPFRPRNKNHHGPDDPPTSFHLIPELIGYTLRNGVPFPNENLGQPHRGDGTWNPDRFVQRWLFFELLKTVVGDVPGKSFHYQDFIETTSNGRSEYITTKALPEYLEAWEEYETDGKHEEGQMMRLVKIQQALQDARRFVFSHCTTHNTDGKMSYDPHLCLSFLVLGETLSAALTRILEINQMEIEGWYDPSSVPPGWGYSQLVLDKLENNYCCPSIISMLKSLFRDNTIGLLLAMPVLRNEGKHIGCDEFKCNHGTTKALQALWNGARRGNKIPVDIHAAPPYETKHTDQCRRTFRSRKCQLLGPEIKNLAEIIDSGNIPILRYNADTKVVDVEALGEKTRHFAIFSHVWEHGFGNPYTNEMYECQLERFQLLIEEVKRDFMGVSGNLQQAHTFWIDTLAIPVGKGYEHSKRQAIRQMHEIYRRASYTIVLDEGLITQRMDGGYARVAMMITVSKWMTRLWTLQEAALSKEIYFNFNKEVYSIDKLEKDYLNEQNVIEQILANIARTYYHNMLGDERENLRKQRGKRVRSPQFVANVWKAAQWRDTAHVQHETLALAILLGLDTEPFSDAANTTKEISGEEKDDRMKWLIQLLAEHDPCLIPAGMIFLPGPRLKPPMFGWAPATWLSHRHIGSPDPLESDSSGVSLIQYGLNVKFPGFDLHNISEDSKKLCSRSSFRFPADAELLEWYEVTNAEDPDSPLSDEVAVRGSNLAIIAINVPLKQQQEIALLVTLIRKSGQRYRVHILNRVHLKREIDPEIVEKWRQQFRNHDYTATSCGAKLFTPRKWCVDGPHQVQPTPQNTMRGVQPPTSSDLLKAAEFQNHSESQAEPGSQEGKRQDLPNNRLISRVGTYVDFTDDSPATQYMRRSQYKPDRTVSPIPDSSDAEFGPDTG